MKKNLILIGNKKDKITERKITQKEIENFCKNNEIETFFETSAKTGESIHDLFKERLRKLYIKYIEPITSDIYSTKTFESTTQNMEVYPCGINSEKYNVCEFLILLYLFIIEIK